MIVSKICHFAVDLILLEILQLAQETSSSSVMNHSSLLYLIFFCCI